MSALSNIGDVINLVAVSVASSLDLYASKHDITDIVFQSS